jgi:hypothetical protein
MAITLKVDGIYIDEDVFTHTKTNYTITNDKYFETLIGTHESSNSGELYEYTFDIILSRKDTLYYIIDVTVEDSDGKEYTVSSGVRSTNVYGQLSGTRSILKTPMVEIADSRIGKYKQTGIVVSDVVAYSDDIEITSMDISCVGFTGEKLWSNSSMGHTIKEATIPMNMLSDMNYIVEVNSNSDTDKSLKGRKLVINKETRGFSELISEPYIYKSESSPIIIKTSLIVSGSILIELRDSTGRLVTVSMDGTAEYSYDSIIFSVKSDYIESGEKYTLSVIATSMNGRTIKNDYVLTGASTSLYINRRNVTYSSFRLIEVGLNLNHIVYTHGYSNAHTNGLVPMPSFGLLAFYDLDDRVINYGFNYPFEEREFVITSTESLAKNFLVMGSVSDGGDNTRLDFLRFNFDNMGSYTLSEDNVIIDYGYNYLDVLEYYNDRYEAILDTGDGFKRVTFSKDDGSITEESGVIDDLSVLRERVGSDYETILVTSIRVGAYLYSFGGGLLTKLDTTNDNVEIFDIFTDYETRDCRFIRVSDSEVILSFTNSSDNIELHAIDTDTCDIIRSHKSTIENYLTSITVDNNNNLCVVTKTNYGHSVYMLK